MATSLGVESGAESTKEPFSEVLVPNSELVLSGLEEDKESDPKAYIAMANKIGLNMKPLAKELMTALFFPAEQRESEADPHSFSNLETENAAAVAASAETFDSDLHEAGPHVLIDVTEHSGVNMKLMVIVSLVAPHADSNSTLAHAGNFILEVTPSTTIREIKQGITNTLEIYYEDMALVFVGKFLTDARTVEYYLIEDGQTLHLLVECPNRLFKDVFEAFKRVGLSEAKAWYASRSFIHVMHNKYNLDAFGRADSPTLTEEQLQYELQQLYIPDSDESDDSSADEDEDEEEDEDDEEADDEEDDDEDEVEEDVDELENQIKNLTVKVKVVFLDDVMYEYGDSDDEEPQTVDIEEITGNAGNGLEYAELGLADLIKIEKLVGSDTPFFITQSGKIKPATSSVVASD